MAFGDVVRKTWNRHHLFSVMLELTYRCNLNCFFCYNDLGLKGQSLSTGDYLRLLRDLAALGVMNLTLTGGEPLAHPDFLRLGAEARGLGFVVRIKSNGHAFRGELARRIRREVDPFLVEVSLHGACAETHDRQTRIPGSFERLLDNLREMRALGLRVKLNSTLTRWNEDEIGAMFALADELGLRLQMGAEVSPRDDGDSEPLAITASLEGVRRLFRVNAERAAKAMAGRDATGEVGRAEDEMLPASSSDKHCGAGSSGLTIDPYGNVYPCVQWRRPVGNLHQRSIREIWSGSEELEEVRQVNREVRDMVAAQGTRGKLLGFCPGSAELATGSPSKLYAAAERQADALERVQAEAATRAPRRELLPVLP